MNQLKPEELNQLLNFINDNYGLSFAVEKQKFIENRIENMIQKTDILNIRSFLSIIYTNPKGKEARDFVDLLTINETYFYRNKPQLDVFSDHVLPEVLSKKRAEGNYYLRIWSAGCSIGCEPYTLSILLQETVPDIDRWKIQILASDISDSVLKNAKKGLYTEREVKEMPPSLIMKYFKKGKNYYHLNEKIINSVQFFYLNLMSDKSISQIKGIDILFCRNVLIYFDFTNQQKMVSDFYDSLNEGGYIFLGHSESLFRLSKAYQLIRFGNDFAYKKD
jgi:chemotaxis protein methyltransferase CheR